MSPRTDQISVLYVEDDPSFAELTATYLTTIDERFRIKHESNARGGIEQLEEERYDCVVSDYNMPGLNGVDFLEKVRETHSDLPFILFTGDDATSVVEKATTAGVTDYIHKSSGGAQFELLANRMVNAVMQYWSDQTIDQLRPIINKLSDLTDDIFWRYSSDWERLRFVDGPYESLWGQPLEQLQNQPTDFISGVHPDDRELVKEGMKQLSRGTPIDLEFRVNQNKNSPLHGFEINSDLSDTPH